MPSKNGRRPRAFSRTVYVTADLAERLDAVEAKGRDLNVSEAARRGILAAVKRAEAGDRRDGTGGGTMTTHHGQRLDHIRHLTEPDAAAEETAEAVRTFIRERHYPPSAREVVAMLGLKSSHTGYLRLQRAVATGLLEQRGQSGGSRSYWPVSDGTCEMCGAPTRESRVQVAG